MSKPQNLIISSSAPAKGKRVNEGGLHRFALVAGLGFGLVMMANMVLLWWDPQFGRAAWELNTVSQTFDIMPLIVLSGLLIGVGAVASNSKRSVRAVAISFGVAGIAVVGMSLLYGMAVIEVGGRINPEAVADLKLTALRTAFVSVVYSAMFALFAVMFWRRARVGRSVVRSAEAGAVPDSGKKVFDGDVSEKETVSRQHNDFMTDRIPEVVV